MRRVLRCLLGLILVLGGARAIGYLVYAFYELPTPLEAFHLEAAMVHHCWRVEAGRRLYPSWTDGPHVANFFGPCYFLAVGLAGRAAGSGLDGLVRIGRGVTFASGLLTTLVVAGSVGRRHGRGAGLAAGVLSLGAAPLFGFGVMVRPDALAELLGVCGFLLVGPGARWRTVLGSALLVLAILTKQTAAVFLLAAVAALPTLGRGRRALLVLLGCLLAIGGIVAAVTAGAEPNFAPGLLGEARTPFDLSAWLAMLGRLCMLGPDLLVLPLAGLVAWGSGRAEDRKPMILTLVLLGVSLLAAGKRGADLNYFLSLRVVAALAAGALWGAVQDPAARNPRRLLALLVLGAVSLVPGTNAAAIQALHARRQALTLASPPGRAILRAYRDLFRMAEDPDMRLLTDCGLVALHQEERAPFVDPWLFHMLVETGRIRPTRLRHALRAEAYDAVISTADWNAPGYASYAFGLPMVLVEEARAHYTFVGSRAGLFVYVPRGNARGPGSAGRSGGSPAPITSDERADGSRGGLRGSGSAGANEDAPGMPGRPSINVGGHAGAQAARLRRFHAAPHPISPAMPAEARVEGSGTAATVPPLSTSERLSAYPSLKAPTVRVKASVRRIDRVPTGTPPDVSRRTNPVAPPRSAVRIGPIELDVKVLLPASRKAEVRVALSS
jgi:hypothetical protein